MFDINIRNNLSINKKSNINLNSFSEISTIHAPIKDSKRNRLTIKSNTKLTSSITNINKSFMPHQNKIKLSHLINSKISNISPLNNSNAFHYNIFLGNTGKIKKSLKDQSTSKIRQLSLYGSNNVNKLLLENKINNNIINTNSNCNNINLLENSTNNDISTIISNKDEGSINYINYFTPKSNLFYQRKYLENNKQTNHKLNSSTNEYLTELNNIKSKLSIINLIEKKSNNANQVAMTKSAGFNFFNNIKNQNKVDLHQNNLELLIDNNNNKNKFYIKSNNNYNYNNIENILNLNKSTHIDDSNKKNIAKESNSINKDKNELKPYALDNLINISNLRNDKKYKTKVCCKIILKNPLESINSSNDNITVCNSELKINRINSNTFKNIYYNSINDDKEDEYLNTKLGDINSELLEIDNDNISELNCKSKKIAFNLFDNKKEIKRIRNNSCNYINNYLINIKLNYNFLNKKSAFNQYKQKNCHKRSNTRHLCSNINKYKYKNQIEVLIKCNNNTFKNANTNISTVMHDIKLESIDKLTRNNNSDSTHVKTACIENNIECFTKKGNVINIKSNKIKSNKMSCKLLEDTFIYINNSNLIESLVSANAEETNYTKKLNEVKLSIIIKLNLIN